MNNKLLIAIGTFLLLSFITTVFMLDYAKTKNLVQDGHWECQEILYLYAPDKYPTVFINMDFLHHPYITPNYQSWFCNSYEMNNETRCIADVIPNAYDQYCFKWNFVKRGVIPHYNNPYTNESYI
jgi:hypothetical protein